MDRFVSKRSSSLNLDASSLDDVRAERVARSAPVCCSELTTSQAAAVVGRPSWQQHWERALQDHILHHHELPHGVRL